MPLFTAIIAFCAFLALLLTGFSSLLNAKIDPVKEDIAKLETGQANLEAGQNEIKLMLIEFKNHILFFNNP